MKSEYDKIVTRVKLRAEDFYGTDRYQYFRADKSIHDFSTVWGPDQQRFCAVCHRKAVAEFVCDPKATSGTAMLKIVAMLENWRLYVQPCRIMLNDAEIFSGELFLENVSDGWPGVYFPIQNDWLRTDASNVLTIENLEPEKQALMLCSADIIVFASRAAFTDSYSSPRVPIFPPDAVPLYAGTDSDDHRHDESGEMERILNYFINTGMGNYVSFRQDGGRTFPPGHLAGRETWLKWIDKCVSNHVAISFHGLPDSLSWPELKARCGNLLKGDSIHEPYLIFNPIVHPQKTAHYIDPQPDMPAIKNSYLQYVNAEIAAAKTNNVDVFCGDPSLLCVYLKDTNVDVVVAEPVGNCALLYGAVRGTGKRFGAHIPVDWYLGGSHDASTTAIFKLLLELCYAYGGEYIYTENSLFKTVSHRRYDWEDDFCINNRQTLRDFCDFAGKYPRRGTLRKNLAAIYGNLESMFWLPDDRTPELMDVDNWDAKIWGRWEDTSYHMAWKAIEAWLPVFSCRQMELDETMTRMFSGTPFGPVDVVSPYSDLNDYRAISFFGWNTMDEKIYDNLSAYVKQGGILLICGCHFDVRVDPVAPIALFRDGKVSDLIGCNICGSEPSKFGKLRNCMLENISATRLDEDLYVRQYGKGKVYFYSFLDIPSDPRQIGKIKTTLKQMVEERRDESEVIISGGDAQYVNYNVWEQPDGASVAYFTNIDWDDDRPKHIEVNYRDKITQLRLKKAETVVMQFQR